MVGGENWGELGSGCGDWEVHLDRFTGYWELVNVQSRSAAYEVGANGPWPNTFHLGSRSSFIIVYGAYGAIVVVEALVFIGNDQ